MMAYRRAGLLHRHGIHTLKLLQLVGLFVLLLGCNQGRENTPAPQNTGQNSPDLDARVFPPAALPFGQGYAAWSAEWWQWAFSLPVTESPIVDETGEKCAIAQRGSVWFLAGVLSTLGTAIHRCSIPAETALFFPLLIEWDNFKIARPFTVQELQDLTNSLPESITDLFIELDGVALQNVQLLHFVSPEFSFTLPHNNLFQGLGSAVSTPGTYFPTVAEGFYVMLRPLSVGEHTLRIHSKNLSGVLDITYYLTVVSLILP